MTIPLGVHCRPTYPAPPPARADVVVIGGGIIGVTAALYAARRGLRVALVEKGRVGAEQSGRNWGWIRVQGRDEAEIPLVLEAQRLWVDLDAEAQGATGLARHGVLYLANTPRDTARHEAFLTLAERHDLTTRMLTRAEVDAMFPGHRGDWRSALWTPTDSRAEPFTAVPAIARLAERAGATLHEGCAARALDIAAGRITGVITEHGRIACDQVVLAGGAWSSLFLAAHEVRLPQLSVRATVAATEPLPDIFAGNATDARFAFRRRGDGGYSLAPGDFHEFPIGPDALRHFGKWVRTWAEDPWSTRLIPAAPAGYPDGWTTPRRWDPDRASPFEQHRTLDPRPHAARVERIRADFQRAFPMLPPVRIRSAWAGMIDSLPDIVPVIDRVAAIPGLIAATGMSGHGFGIGPGVGRVLADLLAGNAPGHDLARFRFDRFGGARPALGPAL